MADEHAQFEALIANLLSQNNEERIQSEAAYESVPDISKIPFLIRIMSKVALPLDQRTMSSVLLRRLYTSSFEEFWPSMEANMKERIKEQHLFGIQCEETSQMRKKMVECVTELARNFIDEEGNNSWPELLKFIFEAANSPDHSLRMCSLIILNVFPGVFGNQQSHYLNIVKEMLGRCLTDPEHHPIRIMAVRATVSIILNSSENVDVQNGFQDLMPGILHEISNSFTTDSEDDIELLKSLIDLSETCPKFIRPQFENVITLCMKILGTEDLMDETRQLSLEVIVTLAENAPAMVRKFDNFLKDFVPQILSMMCDLDDDDDWANADEAEDDDNESNNVAGESALDRLACNLGGKTMLPHILTNVPPMLQSENWKFRHAALMAISSCGEGCHKQMLQMLPDILESILPFLNDEHPRVKYAICNCLGQMATDFGPTFQKKFHEVVIPGILIVMVDFSNPRVQAHAAAALLNFSEECPKVILIPYLDSIILKLELVLNHKFKEMMEKGTKLVLEQAVTTLASVADCAEEKFIQYYDRFIPSLKYIINNAVNKELRMLRGKTIECISLIGMAVGKEKFMSDCSDVMNYLLKSQTDWDEMPEDDPQISYMISAWARMCKILGKDFEVYLPQVMKPVLRAANIKPEVAVLDSDDMKNMEDDPNWQFVTLGEQQSFGIRTAGLEEKATACQMLVCYAKELKQAFAPYADEVVKIMVGHIKFYFHDGVRSAATESLPYLLDCAKVQGDKHQQDMWQFVCPELLKAIDAEPDHDIKSDHLQSMSKCIDLLGRGCFNQEQLGDLSRILKEILQHHFERQAERQEKRKDIDYDDDVEDILIEEDDEDVYLLSRVTDIVHSLLTTHQEDILPFFEHLLPMFTQLLSRERPWADRQWSLCIFDDLIENVGPLSLKYQNCFLSLMIEYITDSKAEVRQAACYGIGLMAQYGGAGFTEAINTALPHLLEVIHDPESRIPVNLNPTENSISAVTKICKYSSPSMNVNDVLPHWLNWLPVWEDHDEVLHIYGYLCDLIENNNQAILGENNTNLPRIVLIIAESLVKDAIQQEDDVYNRLLNIVVQLQANSGEIFSLCISQLNDTQQEALKNALHPLQS